MIELGITKVLPPGATVARSLAPDANRITAAQTYDSAAAGQRPTPGTLPKPGEPSATETDLAHQPIRWQLPYAYNQTITPRRGRLLPFDVLRSFADLSDIVRICIETRKEQIGGLVWSIVPREKGTQTAKGSGLEAKIQRAQQLFQRPDKRRSFYAWLGMAIEDVLVIDALTIYKRKTRGGDLFALEVKDGSTILPLLDEGGDTPLPPLVAYRQIIYGQPITGGDCTADQLVYRPRVMRTQTPYGLSPTEAVLLTINAGLNRQVFNLQYYSDGNVPEGLAELPQGWTAEQIKAYQEYFDSLMLGNPAMRRRLKWVPSGSSKVYEFKEPDWSTKFDEWLATLICAAFGVPPSEIGLTANINKATAGHQENVTYRRGVRPLVNYFQDIFNEVLAVDLDSPELQFVFTGGEPEDKLVQAQTDEIYLDRGVLSVDDIRMRNGQPPIGMGPYIMTSMGPQFVDELLADPDPDDDPNTTDRGTPDESDAAAATAAPGDHADDGPENRPFSDQETADVKRWRAVAIKAAKAGKPQKAFISEAIRPELAVRIIRFLEAGSTKDVAGVVAAFECALAEQAAIIKGTAATGEHRSLTRLEQRTAKRYKKLISGHLKRQGAALVAHLRAGMQAE